MSTKVSFVKLTAILMGMPAVVITLVGCSMSRHCCYGPITRTNKISTCTCSAEVHQSSAQQNRVIAKSTGSRSMGYAYLPYEQTREEATPDSASSFLIQAKVDSDKQQDSILVKANPSSPVRQPVSEAKPAATKSSSKTQKSADEAPESKLDVSAVSSRHKISADLPNESKTKQSSHSQESMLHPPIVLEKEQYVSAPRKSNDSNSLVPTPFKGQTDRFPDLSINKVQSGIHVELVSDTPSKVELSALPRPHADAREKSLSNHGNQISNDLLLDSIDNPCDSHWVSPRTTDLPKVCEQHNQPLPMELRNREWHASLGTNPVERAYTMYQQDRLAALNNPVPAGRFGEHQTMANKNSISESGDCSENNPATRSPIGLLVGHRRQIESSAIDQNLLPIQSMDLIFGIDPASEKERTNLALMATPNNKPTWIPPLVSFDGSPGAGATPERSTIPAMPSEIELHRDYLPLSPTEVEDLPRLPSAERYTDRNPMRSVQ